MNMAASATDVIKVFISTKSPINSKLSMHINYIKCMPMYHYAYLTPAMHHYAYLNMHIAVHSICNDRVDSMIFIAMGNNLSLTDLVFYQHNVVCPMSH